MTYGLGVIRRVGEYSLWGADALLQHFPPSDFLESNAALKSKGDSCFFGHIWFEGFFAF
jgi:hypothetical protein